MLDYKLNYHTAYDCLCFFQANGIFSENDVEQNRLDVNKINEYSNEILENLTLNSKSFNFSPLEIALVAIERLLKVYNQESILFRKLIEYLKFENKRNLIDKAYELLFDNSDNIKDNASSNKENTKEFNQNNNSNNKNNKKLSVENNSYAKIHSKTKIISNSDKKEVKVRLSVSSEKLPFNLPKKEINNARYSNKIPLITNKNNIRHSSVLIKGENKIKNIGVFNKDGCFLTKNMKPILENGPINLANNSINSNRSNLMNNVNSSLFNKNFDSKNIEKILPPKYKSNLELKRVNNNNLNNHNLYNHNNNKASNPKTISSTNLIFVRK